MYILVYIKKFMSIKPNPKEINIIINILKGAQFKFLPRAPFYIDTPLAKTNVAAVSVTLTNGNSPVTCSVRAFFKSLTDYSD
jgi:hypothetical protein